MPARCLHPRRGVWIDKPYIIRLAPDGWKEKHLDSSEAENIQAEHETDSCVSSAESRASWARLIAKIYEIDPMICQKCSSPMKIIAVITDPEEVKKILRHLVKTGRRCPQVVDARRVVQIASRV